MSALIVSSLPHHGIHCVIDADGSNVRVSVTVHKFINSPCHLSIGLISCHHSINRKAHWTTHPVLFISKHVEAANVHQMRALKCYNVLLAIFYELFLQVRVLLELKLANTAFVIFVLFLSQG